MTAAETVELLAGLYPEDEELIFSNEFDVENFLAGKLGIDLESFHELVTKLAHMAGKWKGVFGYFTTAFASEGYVLFGVKVINDTTKQKETT